MEKSDNKSTQPSPKSGAAGFQLQHLKGMHMKILATKRVNLLLIILSLFSSYAQAEDSKSLALLGKKLWVAFECSALASKSGHQKEQERLFLYGYETGKKFIESIKENKIEKEDISSITPIGVMLSLQGPSTDFMLGRIFEGALENALKDVFVTDEKYNAEELQKIIAENKFQKQNCELIGKTK